MPGMMDSKILVVEDDPQMGESLRYLFDFYGFNVHVNGNLPDAINALQAISYDLVILDLQLEDQCGFAVMDHLVERKLDTLVVVVTGLGSEKHAITALKKGATDYLKKPFEPDELLASVNKALGRQRHQRELCLYKKIVSSSSEAIVVGDHHGRIIYNNAAYRRLINPDAGVPDHPPTIQKQLCNADGVIDEQIQMALVTGIPWEGTVEMVNAAGQLFTAWKRVDIIADTAGGASSGIALMHAISGQAENRESSDRKLAEKRLQAESDKLKQALTNVNGLSGMLSICASCKKIRDNNGEWNDLDAYIQIHSNIEFSHGLCPQCARKLYPELYPE